jgi:hypothetical protein
VVAVDCASFLVAALLIAPIHAPPPSRPESALEAAAEALPRTSFWSEWLDGLRLVRGDRTIGLLFLVLGLGTFGGTMLDPLYAAWVRDVLGEGPEVFGLLLTTHAAFGIAGSLVVGRYGAQVSDRTLIGWSSIVAGLATF